MASHDPSPQSSSEKRVRNGAIYERTAILVGDSGIERLQAACVFVAGVGGVGGHCAEALVRAGVGRITLCDHDVVSATNKNRQLIALDSNVGKSKVTELSKRLADINASCEIITMDAFITPDEAEDILTRMPYNYVVDCIDSVECKIALLHAAVSLRIPTFSSGGAGGRLDPTVVKQGDLFETEGDALARHCRKELGKRGLRYGCIQCVYSTEKALPPLAPAKQESGGRDRAINGTVSYMPSLFGLHLSAMVVRHATDPDAEKKQLAAIKRYRKAEKKKEEAAEAGRSAKQKQQAAAAAAAATAAAASNKRMREQPRTEHGAPSPADADGHDSDGGTPPKAARTSQDRSAPQTDVDGDGSKA